MSLETRAPTNPRTHLTLDRRNPGEGRESARARRVCIVPPQPRAVEDKTTEDAPEGNPCWLRDTVGSGEPWHRSRSGVRLESCPGGILGAFTARGVEAAKPRIGVGARPGELLDLETLLVTDTPRTPGEGKPPDTFVGARGPSMVRWRRHRCLLVVDPRTTTIGAIQVGRGQRVPKVHSNDQNTNRPTATLLEGRFSTIQLKSCATNFDPVPKL